MSRVGEECKTRIRQIRRDGNEEVKILEKEKSISQDSEHRAYDRIQKQTDECTKKVDELVKQKEEEILEI